MLRTQLHYIRRTVLGLVTVVTTLLAAAVAAATAQEPDVSVAAPPVRSGAYLGSDGDGVAALPAFEAWRGSPVTVGHTYLAGHDWSEVRGPNWVLDPWSDWRQAGADRLLVLNVPMLAPNEVGLSDGAVAAELARGADGAYDDHFRMLAERLVAKGIPDTVIVLGWEMNGTTYSGRCAPAPELWQAYWRSIVDTMRAVPGAAFRFEFTPSRGIDAIAWPACYPGDAHVDIIGLDTYDQGPGEVFADFLEQPYGMQYHVDFAAEHGKPIAFPEWGLFRHGDNAAFIREMHAWFRTHPPVYETISDYCPHGVWRCDENPDASAAYRQLFGTNG